MASSLFQNNRSNHNSPSDANAGLLQRFQEFAKGITPQQAEKQINELLASGKMTPEEFNQLVNKAKGFIKFFGLK